MKTRENMLTIIFLAAIAGAVIWQYNRFVVKQDFLIYDQVSCDPKVDSCFVYVCEEGDEECDPTPFAKLEKSARFVPVCSPAGGNICPELSCAPGELDCTITTCNEETLENGELCVTKEVLIEGVEIE